MSEEAKPSMTNIAAVVPTSPASVLPVAAPAVPVGAGAQPTLGAVETLKLNSKQAAKKINKAKEGAIAMRQHLWPDVAESQLWLLDEKTRKGFAQLPRTMPQLINIIGDASKRVSGKSVPAGRTYLVLWCRVFSEGFVKIDSEHAAALEAGYTGERNITTWREHVRVLRELGFVDYKEGPSGPTQYILLFNPYAVVKALFAKGWIPQNQYTAFFQRANDIGAASELV